jgi:hypothetical protein
VSDPVPVISEIRRIKNVKISTLHAKAERYRDGFVKLFREHEFAYVIDEDGSLLLDGAGRRVSVTASWFAREMGPTGVMQRRLWPWCHNRAGPATGGVPPFTPTEPVPAPLRLR